MKNIHFSREFKNALNYTNNDIDHFYWRYQKTAPQKNQELVDYLKYLIKNDRFNHAQSTLDKFCSIFIKKNYYGRVVMNSVDAALYRNKLISFDLNYCISLQQKSDQPEWYRLINNKEKNAKI